MKKYINYLWAIAMIATTTISTTAVAAAGSEMVPGYSTMNATTLLMYVVGVIIAILIAIFMYKDAEERGKAGIVWGIIGCICGPCGLIIWLLIRPPVQQQSNINIYQQNTGQPVPQHQSGQQNVTQIPVVQSQPVSTQSHATTETPVCPTCGNQGTFVSQYNRYYCYNCQKYL